jgi:hypothetical protein
MSSESRKSLRKAKLLFAGVLVLCCSIFELAARRWIFAGIFCVIGVVLLLFPSMLLEYRSDDAVRKGGLRLKQPILAIGLLCCMIAILAIMFWLGQNK